MRLADYEGVAASLGAGFFQRARDVVVPLLGTSLMSSLLTVAALSIGEFQISNLISGFLSRTYPVVLLQAFYGATGFACAATVVLLVKDDAEVLERLQALPAGRAGVGGGGRVGEYSLEDWDWLMGVNLDGVAYGCHAFGARIRHAARAAARKGKPRDAAGRNPLQRVRCLRGGRDRLIVH